MLMESCEKYYIPGALLTIDEQLLGFRGKCPIMPIDLVFLLTCLRFKIIWNMLMESCEKYYIPGALLNKY